MAYLVKSRLLNKYYISKIRHPRACRSDSDGRLDSGDPGMRVANPLTLWIPFVQVALRASPPG
jgi:hypothetical protein